MEKKRGECRGENKNERKDVKREGRGGVGDNIKEGKRKKGKRKSDEDNKTEAGGLGDRALC